MGRFPEALLHQGEGGIQSGARLAGTRHQCVRMGQQHEGQAVAMLGAVLDAGALAVPIDHPGIAALCLGVCLLQEAQAVPHRFQIIGTF